MAKQTLNTTSVADGVKAGFKMLPWYIKLAIIIICFIAVWIIVRKIYRGITVPINTKQRAADARAEMTALESNGERASYPDSKYQTLADDLEESMDGWGTWDDDLDDVFNELNNNIDYLKLEAAFGRRDGEDMIGWLKGDLSSSRLEEVNDILEQKGILYRVT